MLAMLLARFRSRTTPTNNNTTRNHSHPYNPPLATVSNVPARHVQDATVVEFKSSSDNLKSRYVLTEEDVAPLYVPRGRWAWAEGLPIENPMVVRTLGASGKASKSECITTINKGYIGGRPVTYINKHWPHSASLAGFYLQLALSKLLRHLQGDIIPYIISVNVNLSGFNIAMELPHDTLWILADHNKIMTPALKERCVFAFQKLHVYGILHGQPDLRHILLGADGRVTIIDFQKSRALVPHPDLGLQMAEPAELAKELRIIKYKLDYDGAVAKENAKFQRVAAQMSVSNVEKARQAAQEFGIGPEKAPLLFPEDLLELPDSEENMAQVWNKPSRKVLNEEMMVTVPGSAEDELRAARLNLSKVASVPSGESGRSTSFPMAPPTPGSPSSDPLLSRKRKIIEVDPPLASPKRPRTMFSPLNHHSQPALFQAPSTSASDNPRKRKKSHSQGDNIASPKRRRATHSSDVSSSPTHAPNSTNAAPMILRPPISYTVLSSFSVDVNTHLPMATTRSSLIAQNNLIKSRDFVSQPHDGLRGYYVPHPPTEGRMAINRTLDIRSENHVAAMELQPSSAQTKYAAIEGRLRYALNTSLPKHDMPLRFGFGLGRLKREWRGEYQTKYHHALLDDIVPQQPRIITPIDDEGEFWESSDTLQLTPRTGNETLGHDLSDPQTLHHPVSAAVRSILRPTAVKPISYRKEDWADEYDIILQPEENVRGPNDGPQMMYVPASQGPVLNAIVHPDLPSKSRFQTDAEIDELIEWEVQREIQNQKHP